MSDQQIHLQYRQPVSCITSQKALLKTTKVSIVLPLYNEEAILEKSIKEICLFLDAARIDYELILCDDNSTDKTPIIAQILSSIFNRLIILRFHERIGKGGTIKNAVKVATGSIFIYMDADLSTSLQHLPDLIQQVQETNGLVVGIRTVTNDRGVVRHFLSVGYATFAKFLFRLKVSDLQCGFKGMKTDVAQAIFDSTRCNGFQFDTELLVNAVKLGVPIKSLKVDWMENRPRGGSRVVPLKAIMTMMSDLLVLRLSHVHNRPLLRLEMVETGFFSNLNNGKEYPVSTFVIENGSAITASMRKVYNTVC